MLHRWVSSSRSFEGTYLYLLRLMKLRPLSAQYSITSQNTRTRDYAAVKTSKFTLLSVPHTVLWRRWKIQSLQSTVVIPTKINAYTRGSHYITYFRTHPCKYKFNKCVMPQGLLYSTTYFSEKKLYIRRLSTRVTGFSKQRKYLQIRKRDTDFLCFPSWCVKDKLKFCQYLIQHEATKLYGWVQNLRYMADNLSSIDLLLIPALVKILFCQHCHNFLFLFVWSVWDAVRGLSQRHHKM
jgi:hypothetical protein